MDRWPLKRKLNSQEYDNLSMVFSKTIVSFLSVPSKHFHIGPTSGRYGSHIGPMSAADIGPTSDVQRVFKSVRYRHADIGSRSARCRSDIQPSLTTLNIYRADIGPMSACRCRHADVQPTSDRHRPDVKPLFSQHVTDIPYFSPIHYNKSCHKTACSTIIMYFQVVQKKRNQKPMPMPEHLQQVPYSSNSQAKSYFITTLINF